MNTIAPQLLKRQIWAERVLWTGFVVFCSQSAPACFELLLQLPAAELARCLADPKMTEKGVKAQLAEYVGRQPSRSSLPQVTLDALGLPA